ncbi:cation transporter [Peteryoungia desertarenae]|uniref:cation transporter n=1 Tax=Peteryoungia desertarenae TaxID=1813451 RepID=UPI003CCE43E5
MNPTEVDGWTVVILARLALAVNTITVALTSFMRKGRVNIRALFLHNLSDALASVAVKIGGALLLLYEMRWVEPAITISNAFQILDLAFSETGDPILILMLGSPPELDGGEVVETVRGGVGVKDVHHVHLWQMLEPQAALDGHVVLAGDRWSRIDDVKAEIKVSLKARFRFCHSALGFELVGFSDCGPNLHGHQETSATKKLDVLSRGKSCSQRLGLGWPGTAIRSQ